MADFSSRLITRVSKTQIKIKWTNNYTMISYLFHGNLPSFLPSFLSFTFLLLTVYQLSMSACTFMNKKFEKSFIWEELYNNYRLMHIFLESKQL